MNTDYENRPITDKDVTNMTWVEFTRPKGANQKPALGSGHSTCYSLVNLVTDALKKSFNSKNITSSYSDMYHVISELEIIITPADVMKWKDENKETLHYL